jgi:polar amino acid transport system permease protein
MNYELQFWIVFRDIGPLLEGAILTLRLSASAMVLGLAVGVLGALAKTSGGQSLRLAANGYVESIRNTPFIVQLFFIYFGLPEVGVKLTANQAALVTMAINLGAYSVEIVRAGIEAVPKGQIEAAKSLGLSMFQIFRKIVLFQALKAIFPSLASQFILIMLGSSVVSTISAEDLTAVANLLQSKTFRSFETYFVVAAFYLAMALGFRAIFSATYYFVFLRGRPI